MRRAADSSDLADPLPQRAGKFCARPPSGQRGTDRMSARLRCPRRYGSSERACKRRVSRVSAMCQCHEEGIGP